MLQSIRDRLFLIELIELGLLGLLIGGLIVVLPGSSHINGLGALLIPPLFFWFCYGTYLLYLWVARLGTVIDIALWVALAIVTASFTFWCWSILDLNRLIINRLLYKGDAPVEYAWSSRSKRIRREWGKANSLRQSE